MPPRHLRRFILAEGAEAARRGVAISYDCPGTIPLFCPETACVMAGQRHSVRLFESLRPTQAVFLRSGGTAASRASMSPLPTTPGEYNGYKGLLGGRRPAAPHHASAIAKKMEELDVFDSVKRMDYEEAVKAGLITILGEETDENSWPT